MAGLAEPADASPRRARLRRGGDQPLAAADDAGHAASLHPLRQQARLRARSRSLSERSVFAGLLSERRHAQRAGAGTPETPGGNARCLTPCCLMAAWTPPSQPASYDGERIARGCATIILVSGHSVTRARRNLIRIKAEVAAFDM